MSARRCSDCGYAYELDVFECELCGTKTAYDPDGEPHFRRDPATAEAALKVEMWRLKSLLDAGYPSRLAEEIAFRPSHEIDLHEAVQLVGNGCPAELAARILL